MLKKFAADIGIVMNKSKAEHQVGFVGPGSVTSMRMLHREEKWPASKGKLCPTQRVLGTLLTYSCSNVAERQARLRAAQARWTVMGRNWSAECSHKRIIFRSMVWSTLLTGWETSSAQPCRLWSFRQIYGLQGTQPHAGKGKWSLD